jgi:repressor LexA
MTDGQDKKTLDKMIFDYYTFVCTRIGEAMSESNKAIDLDQLPARQRDVVLQIVRLTEDCGYPPTLAELAKALGLRNRMTVHQHVAALKKKGFVQWEPGLNRSLRLVGPLAGTKPVDNDSVSDAGAGLVLAPPLGLPLVGAIAAGQPIDAMEHTEYLEIDAPYASDGCFALKVKGESMIDDGIYDGDFVIVKPNPSPRNGEIVVALLEDGCATLKRFFKESSGFRLQPANSTMQPIFVNSREDLNIQGTVVGLFRKM